VNRHLGEAQRGNVRRVFLAGGTPSLPRIPHDLVSPLMDALAASFDGQPIFGGPPWLTTAPFAPISPVDVDMFLGLEPGTTVYASGPMFTVVSTLIGPNTEAVSNLQSTLLGFAGLSCRFGRSNSQGWPGNFDWWGGCRFLPGEVVFDPMGVQAFGSLFTLGFKLVIRRVPGD
jgi:hypothetical protein